MTKALLAAGLLATAALAAPGQEAAAATEPQFEAASIKQAEATTYRPTSGFLRTCRAPDPGRFTCSGSSLWELVIDAYGVKSYQVSGPDWMNTLRFDIVAKVPAGATPEQLKIMLRRLLADRFQMTVHRESREVQGFALEVGANGLKLKEIKDDDSPKQPSQADVSAARNSSQQIVQAILKGDPPPPMPAGGAMAVTLRGVYHYMSNGGDISRLAAALSGQLGHPVVDETGLTGNYNITLAFGADPTPPSLESMGGERPTGMDSNLEPAPSVFKAVQTELGLKLEPKKVPAEIVVVDKAEKTPNAN